MTITRAVQPSMWPDHAPDRPIGRIIPSVITGTNADLIATIAPLYLTGSVLDVTYGRGTWWQRFQPDPFTAHDLHTRDGVDFRCLPHDANTFDAVCFDPPYVISGATTAYTTNFHDAYGIGSDRVKTARTTSGYSQFEASIRDGLHEAIRVSRQWVIVKCMEFSQGPCVAEAFRFHDIPHSVTTWALDRGAIKHDQIVHHTGSGPGGHNIFDVKRARRHHSYLIVFKVGAA